MKYQKKTNIVYATAEQKDQARQMRKQGVTYRQIAKVLGFGYVTVYFWFHPLLRSTGRKLFASDQSFRPTPADYAARLAEIPPDHRSLTGIICGDPVFERSALAKR